MTWIIVIIIIAFVFAVINIAKGPNATTENNTIKLNSETSKQKEIISLMNEILEIGIKALCSQEILNEERKNLVEQVLISFDKDSKDEKQELDLKVKLVTNGFKKLLTEFEYEESIKDEIREERNLFLIEIENGVFRYASLRKIMSWVDNYRGYLNDRIHLLENEITFRTQKKSNKFDLNDDNSLNFF